MKANTTKAATTRDARLPAPGSVIERRYKGKVLKIAVLENGFRFGKKEFSSLSMLARHITGAPSINGPLFFRLPAPTKAKRTVKRTPTTSKRRSSPRTKAPATTPAPTPSKDA